MYKANGRLLGYLSKSKGDLHIANINRLKRKFSYEGKFDSFKHTSSYTEIPPITSYEDSGTYIFRKYRGVELVTLGASIYIVENKNASILFNRKPRFVPLGDTGLRVIRIEEAFRYMTNEGKELQQQLLNEWETLTQPMFAISIFNGK